MYRRIMARLEGKGVMIVVDATKDLLLNVLEYHPFLIKPNNHELGDLFGVELKTREEVVPYGKKLQEMGARNVLISMAGEGAVLIAEDRQVFDKPCLLYTSSIDHPLSFRGFMKRTVYDKVNPELVMPEEQRIFPDPTNPGHIPEVIGQIGGVDICFGGIGINGHVAFNEADASLSNEEFLAQQTRVLKITPETRTANAIGDFNGALEDMPHYCITIGINEISHARKIRLGCFRNWHRAVVRRAVYGEQTSEFPVSLLQNLSLIHI